MARQVVGFFGVTLFFSLFAVSLAESAPFAYVPNQGGATVSVIDTATDSVTETLTLSGTLLGVAVNNAGTKAYFSRVSSSEITLLNIPGNTTAATFTAAGTVHGLAVSPDDTRLYVALRDSGSIQVLDAAGGAVVATVGSMSNPTGIAVSPDGSRVYVANWGGSVAVVNTADNSFVTGIGGLQPLSGIAVSPDGSRVYASGTGSLYVINTSTDSVIAELTGVGTGDFTGVAVSTDGSRVYAGSSGLAVINAADNTLMTTVDTGGAPSGIDLDPAGTKVYAAIPSTDSVKVIDTTTNAVTATTPVGDNPFPFGKFIVANSGCLTPPTGLAGWWSGNDHPLDILGNSDGQLMNGATYATGKINRAFSFDGIDDYVEIAGNNLCNFAASEFSVQFWVYADNSGSNTYLLGKSHPDGGLGWDIRLDNSTIQVVGVNGWGVNITSDSVVPANTWRHIALSATATQANLYINGVLKGTSVRTAVSATANPFRIGYTSNFGGTALPGRIDEAALFSRALTAGEIAASYNAGSAGMCAVHVTPNAGENGTILPATVQTIAQGDTAMFTISPSSGDWRAVMGGTCGGTLVGSTYTTDPVVADCTIEATFYLLGDVNQNGFVRLSDAIFALQIMAGVVPSEPMATTGDVNGDGQVGLAEAMYVLAKVAASGSGGPVDPPGESGTGLLNDTGITWGGNYPSGNNTSCTSNIAGAQDCSQGRDATRNNDWDGHAGFSFTKLDINGNSLPVGAANWSCVRDNVTGLVWEVKTDDGGIHDKDNTYRWGGKTALGSGFGTYYDDWNSLVDGSNNEGFCGYSDWRVPTVEELAGLANLGRNSPAIDTAYFPNTQSSVFWSASPVGGGSYVAWVVGFNDGGADGDDRSGNMFVRLVRSGQ